MEGSETTAADFYSASPPVEGDGERKSLWIAQDSGKGEYIFRASINIYGATNRAAVGDFAEISMRWPPCRGSP